MKVQPYLEAELPFANPFNLTPNDLNAIVEAYRCRKLAEELDILEQLGGLPELLDKLQTSKEQGLNSADSHSFRKAVFGVNRIPCEKMDSYCGICWEALKDTTLRILIVSGVISLLLGAFLGDSPEYGWVEGFAIIAAVAVVVNVTAVNDLQKQKKFNALRDLSKKARAITLLRDGFWRSVHPEELLVGDIVKIENGVTIPADGLLLESFQIEVVEAQMTGENDNIKKLSCADALSLRDDYYTINLTEFSPNEDRHHEIPSPVMLSGTNIAEGYGIMLVIAVGKFSAEGRILELVDQEPDSTPLMKKLDKLAGTIGKGGLFAAILTVFSLFFRIIIEKSVQNSWQSGDAISFVNAFIIGITVLVVAIPEGLPLAVTISLAYSVKKMQKDNNLVRKMHACETMGGADMICSDKTGTLTQNKMTVSEFWVGGTRFNFEKISPTYKTFQAEFLKFLKESIFINSTAFIDSNRGQVGSKTEIAMLLLIISLGHSDYVETRLSYFDRPHSVFPFSSRRKRSSIVVTLEDGRKRLHVKGAAEILLESCTMFLDTQGVTHTLTAKDHEAVSAEIQRMTEKALRVIALAFKNINSECPLDTLDERGFPAIETENLTLIGIAGIRDPIRVEVPAAVLKCQKAGITVRMVTGDNQTTARAIAKECFIITSDDHVVMEGKEFAERTGGTVCSSCKVKVCSCARSKSEAEKTGKPLRKDVIANLEGFKDVVKDLAVLARSSPDDKYTLVTGLKELGHVVAVTGDGTNDAPALRKADIGFAMGIAGTEMAKNAAGIILLDDNFNSIVRAVVWGRNIYDNIRCFLQFQLTVNIVAVVLATVGAVTIQQSPLTSVQLLWVNLIMDSLASLALATDPPTDAHLQRKPHKRTDFIVEKTMWKHIFGQAFMQLTILFSMTFAGEYFLPEFTSWKFQKFVTNGRNYTYQGKKQYIDDYENPSIGPSAHFTYVFNTFVLLQVTNEFNSRKLRDELNVFSGIFKNWLFIFIWITTLIVQVVIVTFGFYAFGCKSGGLDTPQWFVCIAFGSLSLVWRFALLALPSNLFPESGQKENQEIGLGILTMRVSGLHKRQSYLLPGPKFINSNSLLI